jgi:acetyltransferase-like isoleucine patch superfamily enzyme
MRIYFKILINAIILCFPWTIRRILLNSIFKYKINKKAKIGFSIILADMLEMEEHSTIGNFNICKNINLLKIGSYSTISSLNLITGFNTKSGLFPSFPNRKCEVIIGNHSAITIRHIIECNGGFYIGNYTTFAGYRSQVLSHSIDIYKNTQTAYPITIGNYCFVGTGSILLPGSNLPNYSVLGAGSVLNKRQTQEYALYGGVPAQLIKTLDKDVVGYFKRDIGYVL